MCAVILWLCVGHSKFLWWKGEKEKWLVASLSRTERYIGDKATKKYGHSIPCVLMGNQAAYVTNGAT